MVILTSNHCGPNSMRPQSWTFVEATSATATMTIAVGANPGRSTWRSSATIRAPDTMNDGIR